jgi:hypothetical protein
MRQFLAFGLKAAVSVLLVYLSLKRVDLSLVGQRLHHIDSGWLSGAMLLLLISVVTGALRWRQIINYCGAVGMPIFKVFRVTRYQLIAVFFNQVLPSSVGGDAMRIWLLGRDKIGWRTATYTIITDRLIGVLTLSGLVLVCLPWSLELIQNATGRAALLLIGFGSTGACLAFLALGFVHFEPANRWWLSRHLLASARIARMALTAGVIGLQIAGYSLLNHLLTVTGMWCLAQAIAAPLEWTQALFLVLPVLLIITIPLSIAGWGVREATMIVAFGYAGLTESDGLIVSVLYGLTMFAIGMIGALFWILRDGHAVIE